MRTTIDIDPAALAAIRELSAHRGQSMGEVASALILEGLRARSQRAGALATRHGLPVFSRRPGQAPITAEIVRNALEDEA